MGIIVQDIAGSCPVGNDAAFQLCVKKFYDDVKTYLGEFYDGLDVGPGGVRVALVIFTDSPEVQFQLDEYVLDFIA